MIIAGLIVDLGGGPEHDRVGFRYWKNPGALAQSDLVSSDKVGLGRFLGLMSVLIQAALSFQSMELVAIAASETESPRRNISKAVRRVFYRILVFYVRLTSPLFEIPCRREINDFIFSDVRSVCHGVASPF